jgi:hypothetical protein
MNGRGKSPPPLNNLPAEELSMMNISRLRAASFTPRIQNESLLRDHRHRRGNNLMYARPGSNNLYGASPISVHTAEWKSGIPFSLPISDNRSRWIYDWVDKYWIDKLLLVAAKRFRS